MRHNKLVHNQSAVIFLNCRSFKHFWIMDWNPKDQNINYFLFLAFALRISYFRKQIFKNLLLRREIFSRNKSVGMAKNRKFMLFSEYLKKVHPKRSFQKLSKKFPSPQKKLFFGCNLFPVHFLKYSFRSEMKKKGFCLTFTLTFSRRKKFRY